MYRIAARAGIKDFVVPGNKPEVIQKIKETIQAEESTKQMILQKSGN